MFPRWVRYGVGALLGAVAVLFPLAAPSAAAADIPTLRVALTGQIDTLNPFVAITDNDITLLRHQYEALVCLTPEGHVTGSLAESYSSDDGITWTYRLPEGRVWSDGTPITAADVVFSLRTLMDATELAGERYAQVAHFAGLSTSDSRTVTLTLDEPSPVPPGVDLFIVPRHIWAEHIDALTNPLLPEIRWAAVASGPFLTTAVGDERVTMRTNPLYWRGPAAVAGIEWQLYPDLAAATTALRANEVDVVSDLTVAEYLALGAESGISTVRGAGDRTVSLRLNFGHSDATGMLIGDGNPALTDPVVRAAIAMSFDMEHLVDALFAGLGQPGLTQAPPAWPRYVGLPPGGTAR
ncbi:MAG: ABC transporter substrate-binding protein, partial [Propionibacteriaceae bacterium]|nr:ABC transporter substrate-binding protein [Propionibacteriaceae bacterium]